jgi:hypothetical protein
MKYDYQSTIYTCTLSALTDAAKPSDNPMGSHPKNSAAFKSHFMMFSRFAIQIPIAITTTPSIVNVAGHVHVFDCKSK